MDELVETAVSRISRLERPFATRVLRLARSGQVQANRRVLEKDGPAAVVYFGALVMMGMVVGVFGVLTVLLILITALSASRSVYHWTLGVLLTAFAFLFAWLSCRVIQYRRASSRFRRTVGG